MTFLALKPFLLAIFLLFSLVPAPSLAETLANAGFAPETVWFSKEPFFEGERVRIYTSLYNSREEHLSGSVVFRNGSEKIGEAPFSLQSGSAQNVWIEWTAEGGEVVISAEIENATILEGGVSRPVSLEKQKSESRKFIDKDTDKDGVGNLEDEDDDGDGIPDREDENPLVADKVKNSKPTGIFENIEGSIPEAIAEAGAGIFEKTEALRESQALYSQNKIDEIKNLIEKDSGGVEEAANAANKESMLSSGGYLKNLLSAAALYGLDLETIFHYLSLAFHYMNLYIFKWQIVFYAVVLLGAYYLVRRLWRANRGDSF